MPAPHVTAFRHIFVPGNRYVFLLEGTNIESPASVVLSDGNTGVTWSTNNMTFDGEFLEVTATLSLASAVPVRPGDHPAPTAPFTGDGSLTIVVTNGPDSNGGPSMTDTSPPIIATYYISTS